MKSLLLFALVLFSFCGCKGRDKPDTLVESGYDQKEMDEAIARARKEVDAFIAELASPKGSEHAVKAPIQDAGKTEHFWLSNVTYQNETFEGTINNEPGVVNNVKLGQKWKVAKAEISDWMYMLNDKMHGNYTMRPLLQTLPKDQAEQLRAMLATP